MTANYAPLAIKNAGVELEEIVAAVVAEAPVLEHYLHLCHLYRRVAVGILLTSGDPKDFYSNLYNSSRAYSHYLARAAHEDKVTSKGLPFFDAVACRDREGLRSISRASPRTISADREYEEDFFYTSLLMDLAEGAKRTDQTQAALESWQTLADDNPDLRLPLCIALIEADQGALDEALPDAIAEYVARWDALAEADTLHPDDAGTIRHVSTEVLAWIELATYRGLLVQDDYPLAPGIARQFHRVDYPSVDAWQRPVGFSSFAKVSEDD